VNIKKNNRLLLTALAAFLAACGGGGDGGTTPSVSVLPEGVYGGTLTGSTSPDFQMLVLENGDLWAVYGSRSPTLFSVAGFIQGSTSSGGTSFSSANARDYGVAPAVAGTAIGTFNAAAGTIAGSVTAGGQSVTFSGGPIAGSLYNYNAPASVAAVTGSWTLGTTLTGDTVFLNVQPSGSFSATSNSGCTFAGTIAPRASGKNVLNVSVTFGPAPCALPGQPATGIAFYYPLSNGSTQLAVALQNSSRTLGQAAFGTR
jgi:hypothetical protein